MSDSSLQPIILPLTPEADALLERALAIDGNPDPESLRTALAALPFNTLYDLMRAVAYRHAQHYALPDVMARIDRLGALLKSNADNADQDRRSLDAHAALMQTRTALLINAGRLDEALETAAATLSILAREAKRKDEPFRAVLALLLYDLAVIHNARDEYKQAERSIDKSLHLLERLAAAHPNRYGAAHIDVLAASTAVYRSRLRQTNTLAHHQLATSTYMLDVENGVDGATARLADSLCREGETLAKLNRHREAIQYYTRALKYLTRIEPDFTPAQLRMSVLLGESLLNVKNMRDKGIHLLNTMMQKAIRMDQPEWRRRAETALSRATRGTTDFLGIWHKLFPRQ